MPPAARFAVLPQQTTVWSVCKPHDTPPADTDSKVPIGGVAWPSSLFPQHATDPSVLTPHAVPLPAETDLNVPRGGADCPEPLFPEQLIVPSVFTPHA